MNTYTFDSYAVSDLYKDTHGVRPSLWFWDTWNAANDGEKQAIWDNLIAQFEVESDYERQEQLARIEEFELRIKELLARLDGDGQDDPDVGEESNEPFGKFEFTVAGTTRRVGGWWVVPSVMGK